MRKTGIRDEGLGIRDEAGRESRAQCRGFRVASVAGVRELGSGRCHANVSHNWERKWQALRFLEAQMGYFSPIVLKIRGLMFGMEIAISVCVREGRFLSKHAVRASGNGA
jgi:hypothetical protein